MANCIGESKGIPVYCRITRHQSELGYARPEPNPTVYKVSLRGNVHAWHPWVEQARQRGLLADCCAIDEIIVSKQGGYRCAKNPC